MVYVMMNKMQEAMMIILENFLEEIVDVFKAMLQKMVITWKNGVLSLKDALKLFVKEIKLKL